MANSDLIIKRSVIKNFFTLGWLKEKKFNMSFLIGKSNKDLIFEAILPGRGAKAKIEGTETTLETLDIRMNIDGRKKKASLATVLKWIVVEATPTKDQGTGLKGDKIFFEDDLVNPKTLEETLQGEGDVKMTADWTILGWMTIQSEVLKAADGKAMPMVAFKHLANSAEMLAEFHKEQILRNKDAELATWMGEGNALRMAKKLVGIIGDGKLHLEDAADAQDPRKWAISVPVIMKRA